MPRMRTREIEKRIRSAGGVFVGQRGSHRLYVVRRDGLAVHTTVPYHRGDLPTGTVRAIERDLEPLLGKGRLR